RAAGAPRLALAGHALELAVVRAGRDLDRVLALDAHEPRAVAHRARIDDDLAAAAAGRAGPRQREQPLPRPDLAAPAAIGADLGRARPARAGAATGVALAPRRELDALGRAERGLLEPDLDRGAEVAPRRLAPLAEHVEEVVEHVRDGREPARGSGRAEGRMAEPVVGRPLVGIRQHGVGLVAFLEPLLGAAVVRVLVR